MSKRRDAQLEAGRRQDRPEGFGMLRYRVPYCAGHLGPDPAGYAPFG
ncbi:MAG TPA: hypothetical protein VF860_01750 [Candidatus Acidoferrales bacterium]